MLCGESDPPAKFPYLSLAYFNYTMIFGRELQKQFYLRADKINFNHGSFGTVPVEVMNAHYKALLEQESSPEIWFRKTFFQYIDESRQLLAKLVKVPVEELVLVENASYAVNSILKTFPFKVQYGFSLLLIFLYQVLLRQLTKFLSLTLLIEWLRIL